MGHAEPVPACDLASGNESYNMPMHVVTKDSSSTSRTRVVFYASAKSMSGTSLNDHLLVGPTVHPSLIDVLLRFRRHRIALTTDVSRMYPAVLLPADQRDLHRFVWRRESTEPLVDYRMTRLTFGVSASSFAANMAVRQNALDNVHTYPQAAQTVLDSFYVDDGLTGADSKEEAVHLQKQLHLLFSGAGFTLRKWKTNEPDVLEHVAPELKDQQPSQEIKGEETFTKVLGLEWNADMDAFHPTVANGTSLVNGTTKRSLLSNIARVYDVLGWCSPSVIKLKILMQRLWEEKLGWDDAVPLCILEVWEKWRKELPMLNDHLIPRCYYPRDTKVKTIQLHGFCDASESAYAAVTYLRVTDIKDTVTTSLVIAKTKVSPIKRLTIPRLELCGAVLLARLIGHVGNILQIPHSNIHAWTDSLVVLSWLRGNPRRFRTFVGNRVSEVIESVPPNRWQHVKGIDNPADPASRGLFPNELMKNGLWWEGPQWLRLPESRWPDQPQLLDNPEPSEEKGDEPRLVLTTVEEESVIDRFSSYNRLKRVTAWMFRFVHSRGRHASTRTSSDVLTTEELQFAERHWIRKVQHEEFEETVMILKAGKPLPRSNKLLAFHPTLVKMVSFDWAVGLI